MEPAPKLVIARPRRGQPHEYHAGSQEAPAKSQLLARDCTQGHFLALCAQGRHVGLRPPRNDKSEAIAIVSYPARIGDVSRGVEDAAPTTHDRRLPVILPARFCGRAPSSVLVRELVVLLLLHPDIHHELMRQQLHETHLPAHGQAVDRRRPSLCGTGRAGPSSSRPSPHTGGCNMSRRRCSSAARGQNSVLTQPGLTAITRMPRGRSSRASERV